MISSRLLFIAVVLVIPTQSMAFEADVHYGLTDWLALQAGFDPSLAQTIATGDQRVDSGDMQFVDLVAMYACLGKDEIGAQRAGNHHYPSEGKVPGPPETRAVTPDGGAATRAALAVLKIPPNQAAFRLLQLGEALHILQDSWSHQGIPDIPQLGDPPSVPCDSRLAWGHPKTRGGASSHRADLTMYWPADTVAMAKATYEVLTQYPAISATKRNARKWDDIRPELNTFIKAATKTDKARWFASHGVDDASFLEGISLPDGSKPFVEQWPGRKLPPLAAPESRQHAIDPVLLDFYNRFFARWLGTEDFAALVAEFSARPDASRGSPAAGTSRKELEARLKLWRLRDHGRVAELALSPGPLTANQRASIDAIARQPNAYVRYPSIASAYFPLLPRGNDVSPLLPFFIGLGSSHDGRQQAIAVTKFRHAPYDIVAIIAENVSGKWRLKSIVSTVDH